ncbi:Triosephosphate isomerase [bioreactor metagenome]|uniref:Triosephosphate isomerase n=1 Tax=bioreactor metagenome TaxID=1076179 RepID=A0A645ANZ5_9ZZZZ
MVRRQIQTVCSRLNIQSPAFPIAYEPVWAIGTGVNCDTETANAMMKKIRGELVRFFGESKAEQTHLLYGGSVKASNIEGYLQTTEIDGALVGGASLQAKEFKAILEIAGGNIDV